MMKNNKRANLAVEKTKLKGGAVATNSQTKKPPQKKENPLKKELNNTQGLDLANHTGSLIAQPTSIEFLPPNDMSNQAMKPEQTTSGVKTETVKTLRTKVNITDIAMQGRRSFTFEYEGTFHNPRFCNAKIKFSLKLMNHPKVATISNTGYNHFRTTDVDSKYDPMIFPNFLADFL